MTSLFWIIHGFSKEKQKQQTEYNKKKWVNTENANYINKTRNKKMSFPLSGSIRYLCIHIEMPVCQSSIKSNKTEANNNNQLAIDCAIMRRVRAAVKRSVFAFCWRESTERERDREYAIKVYRPNNYNVNQSMLFDSILFGIWFDSIRFWNGRGHCVVTNAVLQMRECDVYIPCRYFMLIQLR